MPLGIVQTGGGSLPMRNFTDTTARILEQVPSFEKLAPERLGLGGNGHSDVVVAHMDDGRPPVPVGLVSKTYNLVQHGELIERALKWITSVPGPRCRMIDLSATANYERILAKFDLGEGLSISPDGKPVNLQLLCRTRWMAARRYGRGSDGIGWFAPMA